MEFIFYVILAFVILGIMLIVGNKHYDNGNIKHENIEATYISGIDNLIGEYKCTLSTLDSKLLVYISKNNLKIELPYNKISSIGNKVERTQEITTTNKSPIARGIVGGALFGSTGAVVGGLSGLNNKTETVTNEKDFIVINYKDKSNNDKTIIFKAYCPGLVKYINNKIGNSIEDNTIEL